MRDFDKYVKVIASNGLKDENMFIALMGMVILRKYVHVV